MVVKSKPMPCMLQHLAVRMSDGDMAALGDLYDHYGAAVYGLTLRIAGDAGTAEDLTQEVFLRVWRQIPNFDAQRGSLFNWIMTIARNSAIDFLRSREGRQVHRSISLEILPRPLAHENTEAEWHLAIQVNEVWKAIAQLKPRERELLELAYLEGFSQSEMSERLGVPLGTVKTWIGMALRQLRTHLLKRPVAMPVAMEVAINAFQGMPGRSGTIKA